MIRASRRTVLGAAVALAGLPALALSHPSPASAADSQVEPGTEAYVDVSVATLWVRPGLARPLDTPSMTNPVDLRAWTAGMTLAERRGLIGKLETQALYGQRVLVLEESGDWVKVVVSGQPTPRDARGYPGWMPRAQLTSGKQFSRFRDRAFALVTRPATWLYDDNARTRRFIELSFNTRLPIIADLDRAVLVATPSDGMKWVDRSGIAVYATPAAIPTPTGTDLVTTIGMFIGLPYLWAGTSGFGFDCSGLTHTVYAAHGVTIPRDADAQAAAGNPVQRDELRPGDLVFFAYNNGTGSIHHVGMYAGDGNLIDAPTNTASQESGVEFVKLDEHRYVHEYAGAVRFLGPGSR